MDNQVIKFKKHSALIQVNAPKLTALQRKAVNFFLYIVQSTELLNLKNNLPDTRIYEIPVHMIKKLTGYSATNNKQLELLLDEISDIKFIFNYLGKDREFWSKDYLFCSLHLEGGLVQFEMPLSIKSKMVLPSMYTTLNLHLLTQIKKDSVIPIYELLKDYTRINKPESTFTISLEALKTLLGLQGKYSVYKDFKKKILAPSVAEINEKLDINVNFEAQKKLSSKVDTILFTMNPEITPNYEKQLDLFEKDELELITEYVQLMNSKERITSNVAGYEHSIKERVKRDKSLLKGLDLTVQKHKTELKMIEEKKAKKEKIEQDLNIDKPVGPVIRFYHEK